jgi:hypothetical protein
VKLEHITQGINGCQYRAPMIVGIEVKEKTVFNISIQYSELKFKAKTELSV